MFQPTLLASFYAYIRIAFLAAFFLLLILLSGAARPLHDNFYRLASALPVFSQANQNILLVTIEPAHLQGDAEFWRQLLSKISEHNPRHITFATLPQEVSLDYLEELAGSVPFTTALRPAIRPDGTLLDLDTAEQRLGTHSHGWLLPIFWNRDGTLGYQRFVAEYPAALAAELVAAAAGGALLDDDLAEEFDLRVSNGTHPLPNMEAQYIVDHGVVADLVTDKWVMIGQSRLYPAPATLMGDRPGLRDELELRGQILQSVIDNRVINHLPLWQALLGLAFILLLSIYVLTIFAHKPVLPLLVTSSLLLLCLALGLLFVAGLEIPVGLAIATPLCTSAAMAALRATALRRALDRLFPLTDTTASFYQERLARLTGSVSLEDILELVWQTLQVKHAIILQLSDDDDQLHAISHRGHPEDVLPAERDISNPPYATAFALNHPVISTQPFFERDGDADVEYLCPLIYDGEKLGFWALSISHENMQKIPHFEDILRQYSAEISSLLYARNRARRSPPLPKLTDQTPTHIKLEMLRRRAIAGESLLRYAQSILNTTDNGLLLFNLFGNLQFTNTAAELFANKFSIPIDVLNSLDLLSVLTGCSAARGQDILLEIVTHNSSVSLPVIITGEITTHVVHVRGVATSGTVTTNTSTNPFATQWVLFEIYDQSRFAQINLEQDKLVLNINAKIGELAAAARTKGLAIKDFLLENEKSLQDVIELNHILKEIENNSGKIERQLITFEDIVANSYHFVEVKSAVQDSIQKHRRQLELRNLTLRLNLPDQHHISRADNHELAKVLNQIWELLLETASDGSTLSIDVQSVDDLGIMCTFDNEGYGLTPGIIDAFGRGEVAELTSTLAALYFSAHNVKQWPGSLILESPIVGLLTVTLTLEGFTVHV